MLLHGHPIAHGERKCATRSAFTQDHADDRHFNARKCNEILGDRIALSALFCLHAAIGTLRIDQAHDRATELLRLFHQAQALAIPFRLRTAEIARDTLVQVLAFLFSDDRDRIALYPTDTSKDRPSSPKARSP